MMDEKKCEGLAELLSAYRDGETTPEERVLVETHLRGCPACAQRLAYYHDLNAAVRRYVVAALPPSPTEWGAARTARREKRMTVKSTNTERARFKPLGTWAALAAVVMVALGLGLYLAGRPAPVQAQALVDKAASVAADPLAGGISSIELERTGWVKVIDGRIGEAGSEVLNQERILWQAPNLWRIENQGMFGNSKFEVNDGKDIWQAAEGQLTTVQPWDPQIDARGRLLAFSGENLADVLASARSCYTPQLTGEETVAGRSAYVIDFGATTCPAASGGGVMNGRRVIWIDKETFFILKSEQYAVDETEGLIAADETTKVVYNGQIDPALFSYDMPAGAVFEDLRPGPAPTNDHYRNQLASLGAKVDYALFVPREVPAGLAPRQPRLSPSVGVELAYVPPVEVEQATLGQASGLWIAQQRATDELVSGWTVGMEEVTVGGAKGWRRQGERNADGTGTDSGVIVVRDGTMISIASFAYSADELLNVAESLAPVSGM